MKKSATPLTYQFHISRYARDKYQFSEFIYSTDGRVIFTDFNQARLFAQRINSQPDKQTSPFFFASASELNALALIDEIIHVILHDYRQRYDPRLFSNVLAELNFKYGHEIVEQTLRKFIQEFPPVNVYRGEITVDDYLRGDTVDGEFTWVSNREIVLEEMLVLWITNNNPAARSYNELFDDNSLKTSTLYEQFIDDIKIYMAGQPLVAPEKINLIEFLTNPFHIVPGSLEGQLEYIRQNWGNRITLLLPRLLTGMDFIREETKPSFAPGPGPMLVPVFDASYQGVFGIEGYPEFERFSPDTEWMPNLVLIAKNTYVWLDQLSRQYNHKISRLDEIPDDEFDKFARWGITGLWLIGIWERSQASKKIKQITGNPEAVASAYSIYSYEIANELGGDEALRKLQQQTARRGIRLAADMVPNHMGIDSPWVINHPDWFISLDEAPYPNYTFNGTNLSWDNRIGIYLEDHYYDHTDAAVVFKRVDFWTGSTQYIYHGNDGTAMPWNDTAQLNYLIPEVREAVIQTILHVARQFPVIRFDAAMTLAKKHYHRLWFPEPGSGGDIPSRAGLGLSKPDFDEVFPEEFWREVVDRVASEIPDTLLLAEAFWLMEGYFVRTLGMHRVYNSAFMNMLREEKNQEYRQVIKNTLEFDPEILKRYVNFMNNPDERTAVEQFGKGEKYFGISTLLATLPGLPMLGHGQIEGYFEKYGMEYSKSYWLEEPDQNLIKNHEKFIFPLLRQRNVFADVVNFRLYDFFTPEGIVDEDVFVYSNSNSNQQALVVYHNRHKKTVGWINNSTAYPIQQGEEKIFIQSKLAESISLPYDSRAFVIFRDLFSDQEYIQNCQDIHDNGLFLELFPYHSHVFQHFQIVYDSDEQPYRRLAERLGGSTTYRIDIALREMLYENILTPFKDLLNVDIIQDLINLNENFPSQEPASDDQFYLLFSSKLTNLLQAVSDSIHNNVDDNIEANISTTVTKAWRHINCLSQLPIYMASVAGQRKFQDSIDFDYPEIFELKVKEFRSGDKELFITFYSIILLRSLSLNSASESQTIWEYAEKWTLINQIRELCQEIGLDEWKSVRLIQILKIINKKKEWITEGIQVDLTVKQILNYLFQDEDAKSFLNINRYDDQLWFNKEKYELLMWWIYAIECHKTLCSSLLDSQIIEQPIEEVIGKLLEIEKRSGFKVEQLFSLIQ